MAMTTTGYVCVVLVVFALGEVWTSVPPSPAPAPPSAQKEQPTESNVTRESCQVCNNAAPSSKQCQHIHNEFGRKYLSRGYHCMATIPIGACAVQIAQKKPSRNVLALRHPTDSYFFLNDAWIFQGSGNYTVGDIVFTYFHPERQNKEAKEEINFTTQLSQAIEACLISQGKNHGVLISYVLPPTTIITRQTDSTLKKENDDDVGEMKELGKDATKGSNKGHGLHREEDEEEEGDEDEEEGEEDEEEEGDGDEKEGGEEVQSSGSGHPSWVNDLRNIMKVWEKLLNGTVKQVGTMRKRLGRMESNLKEHGEQLGRIEGNLKEHGEQLGSMEGNLKEHGEQLGGMDKKTEQMKKDMTERFTQVEDKFDADVRELKERRTCVGGDISHTATLIDHSGEKTVYFGHVFPRKPTVMAAPKKFTFYVWTNTKSGKASNTDPMSVKVKSVSYSSAQIVVNCLCYAEEVVITWLACI